MLTPLLVLALVPAVAPPMEAAKRKPTPATGGWVVSKSVSKMDDSQTVVLKLRASSPISGWPARSLTPTLLLRCQEGQVSAYVNVGMRANVESGNLEGATVTIRFDKDQAQDFNMEHSTDGEALFFEDAKGTILQMVAHQSMVFRFTPFNSDPQETGFNLRGLGTVIKQLGSACKWDPEGDASAAEANARAEATEEETYALRMTTQRTERLLDRSLPLGARLTAAHDLRGMRAPKIGVAVPALVKALSDPILEVQLAAMQVLGHLGPAAADAIPALTALDKPEVDQSLRAEANAALQRIGR